MTREQPLGRSAGRRSLLASLVRGFRGPPSWISGEAPDNDVLTIHPRSVLELRPECHTATRVRFGRCPWVAPRLNLEYETLRWFGVDHLPDDEMRGYSQAINIVFLYFCITCLHGLLLLAVRVERAWKAGRAAAAAAAAAAKPAAAGPVAEGRALSAGPLCESKEDREKEDQDEEADKGPKYWGMPVFLVFPWPQIFIIMFFLVSLAACAGTLVSVGASSNPVRKLPIIIGCILLAGLSAFVAFVSVIVFRVARAFTAHSFLDFVHEPPPFDGEEEGKKEGRFMRWLRVAEVRAPTAAHVRPLRAAAPGECGSGGVPRSCPHVLAARRAHPTAPIPVAQLCRSCCHAMIMMSYSDIVCRSSSYVYITVVCMSYV